MIYTIKKIFKYTETVEVRADSEEEAKDLAHCIDGDHNNDDHLYDCKVIKTEEEQPGPRQITTAPIAAAFAVVKAMPRRWFSNARALEGRLSALA
jgi:hypothetical protein